MSADPLGSASDFEGVPPPDLMVRLTPIPDSRFPIHLFSSFSFGSEGTPDTKIPDFLYFSMLGVDSFFGGVYLVRAQGKHTVFTVWGYRRKQTEAGIRGMSRMKKPQREGMTILSIYIDEALVERLDALADAMGRRLSSSARTTIRVSRSAYAAGLLSQALADDDPAADAADAAEHQ